MKNPAGNGGASVYQAGWQDKPKFTAKSQHKQDQRRARALLRVLADAARRGMLAPWQATFVVSLNRQVALRRWHPSPRQCAVIERINAGLGEAIDHGDGGGHG